ncbi:outer membrane beta-barrel protein [Polynucleobacter sp. 78F-HAINBA]|uniref:outer membrane protein n=1 Tax=Polynucleobacter sp. 78F-HAINBA TaxID=2689099 RepID=UPI001C0C7F9D|nr:outer membrane beta-barrel protein [Polynucleobacter sp. 78F-HAINBA]MBU3591040.1 outer membrane beta-barrel protein [Polynucleobacter sp. 78F-HAINBA]
MKTVKISALVLAMAGAFATSANAQSAKTNAWEGFYAEAAVGYGSFTPTIGSAYIVPKAGPTRGLQVPVSTQQNDLGSGTNKIGLGYTFGIDDKYTLGIAASYSIGASSPASGSFWTASTVNSPTWFKYQIKDVWSVTVNPGYVIDKDKLAYAKVGMTGNTMGINGGTANYQTYNFTGYVLGLGYKQMVTQSVYFLGEVNYAGISSKTATIQTSSGPLSGNVGGSGVDVLVGVGYKF